MEEQYVIIADDSGGTSALFWVLQRHPQITCPSEKLVQSLMKCGSFHNSKEFKFFFVKECFSLDISVYEQLLAAQETDPRIHV